MILGGIGGGAALFDHDCYQAPRFLTPPESADADYTGLRGPYRPRSRARIIPES